MCLFAISFRERGKETVSERAFAGWLSFQMATMAKDVQGVNQEPRASFRSPT